MARTHLNRYKLPCKNFRMINHYCSKTSLEIFEIAIENQNPISRYNKRDTIFTSNINPVKR